MDKFDINEVENVLADQRDMKGLIDCFSDKLEGSLPLLTIMTKPDKSLTITLWVY